MTRCICCFEIDVFGACSHTSVSCKIHIGLIGPLNLNKVAIIKILCFGNFLLSEKLNRYEYDMFSLEYIKTNHRWVCCALIYIRKGKL